MVPQKHYKTSTGESKNKEIIKLLNNKKLSLSSLLEK